jgi:hypothetical protein
MKRKFPAFFLIGLVSIFLLAACAPGQKPISQMSPKEKAAWMMGTYNAQYDDYLAMATQPGLTDAQKEVLKAKKKILQEVWDPIKLYAFYVDQGGVPSPELEAQIMVGLNKLDSQITK